MDLGDAAAMEPGAAFLQQVNRKPLWTRQKSWQSKGFFG